MKRGNDSRNASDQPEDPNAAHEVMAIMFVLVEKTPGVFTLRLVKNDEVIQAIRSQGALQGFLNDVDELYADFRRQLQKPRDTLASPMSLDGWPLVKQRRNNMARFAPYQN